MFQSADDFIIFLGWTFHNTTLLLKQFFLPLRYIFAFLKTSTASAFGAPVPPATGGVINPDVLNLIHSFPYFDTLVAGIFISLGIIFLVVFLNLFHRV